MKWASTPPLLWWHARDTFCGLNNRRLNIPLGLQLARQCSELVEEAHWLCNVFCDYPDVATTEEAEAILSCLPDDGTSYKFFYLSAMTKNAEYVLVAANMGHQHSMAYVIQCANRIDVPEDTQAFSLLTKYVTSVGLRVTDPYLHYASFVAHMWFHLKTPLSDISFEKALMANQPASYHLKRAAELGECWALAEYMRCFDHAMYWRDQLNTLYNVVEYWNGSWRRMQEFAGELKQSPEGQFLVGRCVAKMKETAAPAFRPDLIHDVAVAMSVYAVNQEGTRQAVYAWCLIAKKPLGSAERPLCRDLRRLIAGWVWCTRFEALYFIE